MYFIEEHPGVFRRYEEYFNFILRRTRPKYSLPYPNEDYTPEYESRGVASVELFLKDILKQLDTKEGVVEIDCVGVMLSTVRKTLLALIKENKLPKSRIRVVMSNPNEDGVQVRSTLEQHPTLPGSAAKNVSKIRRLVKTCAEYNGSILEVRLLAPDPNIYMVRVNSYIYSSPYYGEEGSQMPYSIFEHGASIYDTNMYNHNLHLFKRYFNTHLSIPLP